MAVVNGAYPVLPGKLEDARAFAKETMGARRSEFDELQKRSGTTRETWTIQEGPDGSALVLVWFECDDPEKTFVELAQDPSEFANWFRAKVKDITGVDLTEPAEGAPDLVVDWSA